MNTIETYKDDASAEGRLYYWQLSWAMAQHHPVFGAGFRWSYFPDVIEFNSCSAPVCRPLTRPRAAHSIWFQTLGDQGFVGLALFVGLFLTGLLNAAWIVRRSAGIPDASMGE